MIATGSPRQDGSKPSAYGSIEAILLYRYIWMYPPTRPSFFVSPIALLALDGAGECDGTDGATGCLANRDLRITAGREYRQQMIL